MSKRYTLGPDVPADESVRDSKGNPIDADYIDRAVEDVHTALGRPSLSGDGRSPRVTFRVSADIREAAERLAEQEGITLSTFARQAPRGAHPSSKVAGVARSATGKQSWHPQVKP